MATERSKVEFSSPHMDPLIVEMDLCQAASPLRWIDDDGGINPTQYQTADARHDFHRAVALIVQSLGRDYWADPDDDADEDEDDMIKIMRLVDDASIWDLCRDCSESEADCTCAEGDE